MHGKEKCKILKEIRRQIAKKNDIEYITSECKHQGNCKGTCPKCESEVRYLEKELEKRRLAGKRIVLAGISAALVTVTASCELPSFGHNSAEGDLSVVSTDIGGEQSTEILTKEGIMEIATEEGELLSETGDICETFGEESEIETIMGDIAYPETEIVGELPLDTDEEADGQ